MALQAINKLTTQLSNSAFWDIDRSKLDVDLHADFTIIRVFERGTLEDVNHIVSYYEKSKIIQSLTQATSLQPRAIALGEKLFGLSQNQFTCLKPSPQAMNYSKY